eukprot:gene23856-biopygen19367
MSAVHREVPVCVCHDASPERSILGRGNGTCDFAREILPGKFVLAVPLDHLDNSPLVGMFGLPVVCTICSPGLNTRHHMTRHFRNTPYWSVRIFCWRYGDRRRGRVPLMPPRSAHCPWDNSQKPTEFKAVVFSMCFFHSIVIERKKFGKIGWNRGYSDMSHIGAGDRQRRAQWTTRLLTQILCFAKAADFSAGAPKIGAFPLLRSPVHSNDAPTAQNSRAGFPFAKKRRTPASVPNQSRNCCQQSLLRCIIFPRQGKPWTNSLAWRALTCLAPVQCGRPHDMH